MYESHRTKLLKHRYKHSLIKNDHRHNNHVSNAIRHNEMSIAKWFSMCFNVEKSNKSLSTFVLRKINYNLKQTIQMLCSLAGTDLKCDASDCVGTLT